MAGRKKIKIDIRGFEVSRGASSPKSPDISTPLRLSTFEHHVLLLPVADLEGGRAGSALPPPFGRRTDAITVLLISDNGTVLWRRHR